MKRITKKHNFICFFYILPYCCDFTRFRVGTFSKCFYITSELK